MKGITILFTFSLLIFSAHGNVNAQKNKGKVIVFVNQLSVVNQAGFTIGDISEIKGLDKNIISSISEKIISDSPPVGETLVLDESKILDAIRELGFHDIEVNIPMIIQVRRQQNPENIYSDFHEPSVFIRKHVL